MIEQLKKLTGIPRLQLYLDYLENKKNYTPEERASIEELFEEDG